MEHESPFVLAKRLEAHVRTQLAHIDVFSLEREAQQAVQHIRQMLADARLDARDYELSETRADQLDMATQATNSLQSAAETVATLDVFGPADVAQINASIERIISNLR